MLSWIISAVLHLVALLLLARVNILKSHTQQESVKATVIVNVPNIKDKTVVDGIVDSKPSVTTSTTTQSATTTSTVNANKTDPVKVSTKEDFIKDIVGK